MMGKDETAIDFHIYNIQESQMEAIRSIGLEQYDHFLVFALAWAEHMSKAAPSLMRQAATNWKGYGGLAHMALPFEGMLPDSVLNPDQPTELCLGHSELAGQLTKLKPNTEEPG